MSRKTFHLVSTSEFSWLECNAFAGIPWLIHAFSTRRGDKRSGLKPGRNGAYPANGGAQRGFLAALGAEDFRLASLRQTHSALIYSVRPGVRSCAFDYHLSGNRLPDPNPRLLNPSGDALITDSPGILLSVRTADCLPVLLIDAKRQVVAAVHAGWRGALSSIIEKAVGEMRRVFQSKPADLTAAIGPSIRSCCYEVGEEVVEAFRGRFAQPEKFFRTGLTEGADREASNRRLPLFFSQAPPGHQATEHSGIYLDLAVVALSQLELAGIERSRIHIADYCTSCKNDLLYSYRKEGSRAGRMVAVIGIRPPKAV